MFVAERPNFHPHVCIICGVGDDRREWYVDLQLAIDNHFNPLYNGAIYFCNECWDATVRDVSRAVQAFTPAKQVNPHSYENSDELLESITLEQDNGRNRTTDVRDSETAGTVDDSAVDDQPTELGDPQLEFGSGEPSEGSTDAEPELAGFHAFFGREGG